MIIYHKNLKNINIAIKKTLKYSPEYSFIPLQILSEGEYIDCIFQTPLLFIPYGIHKINNDKNIIDLSFQNKINDKDILSFETKLIKLYKIIQKKYKNHIVNNFIKKTNYENCMRLKVNNYTKFYDQFKNLTNVKPHAYGKFIIHLDGLWIHNNNIWFQWTLLQGKINQEIRIDSYSFIEEETKSIDDKYDKMIKMGVPKEAVEMKKKLEKGVPPPPPLPNFKPSQTLPASKIKASDLQSVILKKSKNHNDGKRIKVKNDLFEPPSLEELQITISKLKKI